jgi:hypothetical protein
MTKNDFRDLFIRALDGAAADAEARLAKPIPRSFVIELHAPTSAGRRMSVHDALDHIYLGDDRFYKIIDVAISGLSPRKSVAFVRVSGHPPTAFSQTWDPSNLGPFKRMIAERIEDRGARTR